MLKNVKKYQSIFPEQLNQPGRPEELEKTNLEKFRHIDDAPNHGDKVKSVPGVFEVVLERQVCFRHLACLPALDISPMAELLRPLARARRP